MPHGLSFLTASTIKGITTSVPEDVDLFRGMYKVILAGWLTDRTETVELPFSTYILPENRIYGRTEENIDLQQSCYNRVAELISTNKKIYLMWSGGIDSTLMVQSFIQSGLLLDNVIVVCSNSSIKEYSTFFNKYVLPTFKIESLDWILHQAQHILLDGILVGAEHGDLICGYDFTFDTIKYLGLDYLKFPATTTNIVKFLKIKGMDEKPAHAWADLFKATFEKSPRPIVDMADFAWWAGFNFRWQHAREKLQIRLIEGTDYQTFFGSRDFQVWSSNNKFVINSVNDIKRSFREEIYRFTNDTNYSNNKIKYPSVSFMYGTKNKYNALTYNRQLIRVSDPMMYYNPNNFFSTWLKTQERKDI